MANLYRSILIPIEFDDPSLVALRLAKRMAMDQGATVHLLHVAAKLPAFGESDFSEDEHSPGEAKARAMLVELASQQLAGIQHEVHTASAFPRALAQVIVRSAAKVEADVIVLKTHGRKGLSRFILGNVAEEVVRTASCPVLTLSPAAREKVAQSQLEEQRT